MPKDLSKEEYNTGREIFAWQFPEFSKQNYSRGWFIGYGAVLTGLLIYSIFTANILFIFILVIATVIIYINRRREPDNIRFRITEEGIILDQMLYEWPEIKNFWIAYEPPEIKNLYFEFKGVLLPRLPIPLQDKNPVEIRNTLLDYIEEDIEREGEPISDNIGRKLKL